MDITIERSLAKSFELAQKEWRLKTLKSHIYLYFVLLIVIALLFILNYATNAEGEFTTFNLILGAVIITYALTSLRVSFTYKTNYFKEQKQLLSQHIPYTTILNLTTQTVSFANANFNIIYNWSYFKSYKVKDGLIFIQANKFTLGIVIALDELSEIEQHDLFNLLNEIGIKKT